MKVPKAQHRYIEIQEILQLTGVKVENCTNDTIVLLGPQEKLSTALSMVYDRINSVCTDEIHTPQWIHKYIGGEIEKLKMHHPHLHIDFIGKKINIEGPSEQVKIAREKLDGFVIDCTKRLKDELNVGELDNNKDVMDAIDRSSLEVNILHFSIVC